MRDVPRTLCQPDDIKSCGACCGMYNQRHESHRSTMRHLIARTLAYRQQCDIHELSTLARFRARWEPDPSTKILDGLPSCPFLGLLELRPEHADLPEALLSRGRVGCLVHPLQNDGEDGRDCGVYDRVVCEDYLCASHDVMRQDEKRLVLDATHDSYLYGLVITDTRFVRELFERTADLNGSMPQARHLQSEAVWQAAAAYFELKREWPWRAADGIFGQVVAAQGLETSPRPSPCEQVGVSPDAYESILRCLGTQVSSPGELQAARDEVTRRVACFAEAVAASQ